MAWPGKLGQLEGSVTEPCRRPLGLARWEPCTRSRGGGGVVARTAHLGGFTHDLSAGRKGVASRLPTHSADTSAPAGARSQAGDPPGQRTEGGPGEPGGRVGLTEATLIRLKK